MIKSEIMQAFPPQSPRYRCLYMNTSANEVRVK